MEKAAGIEPEHDEGIRKQLEKIMSEMKKQKGITSDTDLNVEDLKRLCASFKVKIKEVLKRNFPTSIMNSSGEGLGRYFLPGLANGPYPTAG